MTAGRVVFMGSPAMAVAALEALAAGFAVPLAVTQPDRPSGRGRRLAATAVHTRADELGIPVLATADVNAPECVAILKGTEADAVVVVSFGQILKRHVLGVSRCGCVNVHFSLLPELRGAAPVAWAIIRGLRETGVSLIQMTARMDAGPVIAQAREPVREDDTASALSERLGALGARLLGEVLGAYLAGGTKPAEQDKTRATYAPKITRSIGALDWSKSAEEIDRLIRGLSGQLEAYAFHDGAKPVRVTFYNSGVARETAAGPGVAARGEKGELLVGCGRGAIEVKEIQAEGRKRMSGRDFANGWHIRGGERFLDG